MFCHQQSKNLYCKAIWEVSGQLCSVFTDVFPSVVRLFESEIPLFISVSVCLPAEAKQRGVMVSSCNVASLIPQPLPQSCQSPRCALLPSLPTLPSPSQMREEYKCLWSLKHSSPPPPLLLLLLPLLYPFSRIYTALSLPPSIPDCFLPRTAKDILLSEIRVTSADTTWRCSRSRLWWPPCRRCRRSHTEALNAYV